MKKILAIIVCLSVVFTVGVPVAATTTPSIRVTSIEGAVAGSIVSVPIVLENNSGFVSLSVKVVFDSSALTLETVTDVGTLNGGCFEGNYTSPYYLVWENDIAEENNIYVGEIAVLQFFINENTDPGIYNIELAMDCDGALDKEGNEVEFSLYNGSITVSEPMHECTFGDWEPYGRTKHIRYCDECDKKEYASHNWNDGELTEEPSHGVEGEMTYTCEDCGHTKTSVVDAEEHSYGEWSEYDDEQHQRSCDCGDVEYEDHVWDDGVVTTPATETEEGVRTFTCDDCGETKTESIPVDTISVTGIQLDKEQLTMALGINVRIQATISPDNATNQNVIWESSDPEVASVSDNGLVTANKAGTATITARTEDGDFEATCEITVRAPETHVPGDINGDTNVNNKDLSLLFQYLSDWDVEVNESALDVNGDGDVNNKDLSLLFQYLSDWDVEIH